MAMTIETRPARSGPVPSRTGFNNATTTTTPARLPASASLISAPRPGGSTMSVHSRPLGATRRRTIAILVHCFLVQIATALLRRPQASTFLPGSASPQRCRPPSRCRRGTRHPSALCKDRPPPLTAPPPARSRSGAPDCLQPVQGIRVSETATPLLARDLRNAGALR